MCAHEKTSGHFARSFPWEHFRDCYRQILFILFILIYTVDVSRGSTRPELDLTGFQMHITEAFLTELDGEQILKEMAGEEAGGKKGKKKKEKKPKKEKPKKEK